MEKDRICSNEESLDVDPKEEDEDGRGPADSFDVDLKEEDEDDRGPADTVNAGRVYCYSSEEEDEEEEEAKPWSERLRRRPRCVRVPVVSPVVERLDLGTFTPMMTSEPRMTSMMATAERHRTMTMPSVRLLDSDGLLQSLKRGHGENWEGRLAKKRGNKHVGQEDEVEVEGREVEKRRRRRRSSSDEERRVFKRERKGSDYGSLSSLDSDMLK